GAVDADGDTLVYSITGGNEAGLFAIDSATGAISVTQDIDDAELGDYSLSVQVVDNEGGVDTATVDISLDNINDQPVANADTNFVNEGVDGVDAALITGNVIDGQDHGSDAAESANGAEAYADVADTDIDSPTLQVVQVSGSGGSAGDGSTPIGAATVVAGLYGTLTINADGSYSYDLDDSNPILDPLNVGDELNDTFSYTVSDGALTSTTSLTITINGQDDASVLELAKDVWLPADPGQLPAEYTDGYPLNLSVYDVDTDLTITFTSLVEATVNQAAEGDPADLVSIGKVVYWDGDSWEDVALNQEFDVPAGGSLPEFRFIANPDLDVNFISAEITDLITYTVTDTDTDGTIVNETANVTLHALPPNELPQQSAQVGNGSSPLTSGNDQESSLVLEQSLVNSIIADPTNGSVTLFTDFQQSPFTVPIDVGSQDGAQLEEEVTATVTINGVEFMVIEGTGNGGGDADRWVYDAETGLMKYTASYTEIVEVGGTQTLAEYLTANPPSAGDTWDVLYNDDDGGNYQARFVRFDFSLDDPGDLGITAVGTNDPNLMFGTNNADDLTGGSSDDLLFGRDGNDILTGLGGNDSIVGGDGADTIYGGAGSDTITGGTGADTYIWQDGDADGGVDTITDFNAGEGDVLDLADLLDPTGALDIGGADSLDDYLKASFDSDSGQTTINVYTGGDANAAGTIDQTIVVNGDVSDLTTLLAGNNLDVDQ
ncbi:VCBS domain-containing protein, partial [Neptuniibacter sp. CAU 1671]|uniref:VCBS domain-containing protein n=1 Tax=Neptuniibacter sp. CAU 1671 TaxID=3032593 RepID=UPI0023DBC735